MYKNWICVGMNFWRTEFTKPLLPYVRIQANETKMVGNANGNKLMLSKADDLFRRENILANAQPMTTDANALQKACTNV